MKLHGRKSLAGAYPDQELNSCDSASLEASGQVDHDVIIVYD